MLAFEFSPGYFMAGLVIGYIIITVAMNTVRRR